MKRKFLVKKVLGTDSVQRKSATGVLASILKDTLLKQTNESTLTVASTESKRKIQVIDEFQFSQRCYCGIY